MSDGIAELAVLVQPTGEEIVQESLFHLLQLGDNRLGLLDCLVDRVQDLGDAALLL